MNVFVAVVAKDLRVEWHNRRRIQSLLLFGAVLAALIGYSYRAQPASPANLPPLIWMLTVFLQLLYLGQIYQAEIENGCFEGLRLSPVPRWRIALAKVAAQSLLVAAADLLVLAMLSFFSGSLLPLSPGLLLLLAVETIGVIALGNLLFASTAAGEPPAVDLYALVLLLAAPLILFGPDATRQLFDPAPTRSVTLYFLCLGAYTVGLVAVTAATYRDFMEGS